jgi:hypothetical protein
MRLAIVATLLLIQTAASPYLVGPAHAGEVVPGMTRRDVVLVLGPPAAVRLERNAIVCLTYPTGALWRSRLLGERTRVIALKEGRVIDDAVVRSERIRFHCSRVAGQWDPPMRTDVLCDERRPARC